MVHDSGCPYELYVSIIFSRFYGWHEIHTDGSYVDKDTLKLGSAPGINYDIITYKGLIPGCGMNIK